MSFLQHASEAANMALELLQQVSQYTIPHLPEEHLKLRIGLHSGKFQTRNYVMKTNIHNDEVQNSEALLLPIF